MSKIDEESVDFLRAVKNLGGKARSDLIRIESGLSKDQRDRRFDKLENGGYILVSREDEPINGGGFRPRIARLSNKGRQYLRELDSDEDVTDDEISISRIQFEEFQESINRLESQMNTITQTVLPQVDPTVDGGQSDELETLQARVDELEEAAQTARMYAQAGWWASRLTLGEQKSDELLSDAMDRNPKARNADSIERLDDSGEENKEDDSRRERDVNAVDSIDAENPR